MTGSGTVSDPYIITTGADLEAVNNDLTAYYELGKDIDLSGGLWIPIGWTAEYDPDLESPFEGHFDGKGHKISNMTVTVDEAGGYDYGLFAWARGTITNVILCNATVNVTLTGTGGCDVGLLIGAGWADHCKVSGTINIYGTGVGKDIGGIAGYDGGGDIVSCRADVTVERHHPTEGYASQVDDVGGIAGEVNDAYTVSDCQASLTLVSKTVSAFKASGVGGIVGAVSTSGSSISNCHAVISLVQQVQLWPYNGYMQALEYYVGGIVGCSTAPNTTDRSTVEDCFASGTIEGYSYCGGICGSAANLDIARCGADVDVKTWGGQYIGGACGYGGATARLGTLTDCYALGKVTGQGDYSGNNLYGAGFSGSRGTLTRCYSAGLVTPNGANASTYGGFCPQGTDTVTDCYFDTETSGQTAGMGTGKTTAQMQTQSTFTGWNFSTVWNIASGLYPFLRSAFVAITDGCASAAVHSFPWIGKFQLSHVV